MPSTWKTYGVDANGDGRKDPYNPVDAICAAARYLKAAGGDTDLRRAIFAYNHADLVRRRGPALRAAVRQAPRRPGRLADRPHRGRPLPGRRQGPLRRRHLRAAAKDAQAGEASTGNVADVVQLSPHAEGSTSTRASGAPVVAVNDGTIKKVGHNKQLGNYIVLQDAYGNRFTYAQLGRVAKAYPVPKKRKLSASDFKLVTPKTRRPTSPLPRASRSA